MTSTSENETVIGVDFPAALSGDSTSESGGRGTRWAGMGFESRGVIKFAVRSVSEGIGSIVGRASSREDGRGGGSVVDEVVCSSTESGARFSVSRARTAVRI